MSREIMWQRQEFLVVKNGSRKIYITVINNKDSSHTHISHRKGARNKDMLNTAIFVAQKARLGIIKERYPYFLKVSIFRIMDKKHQDNFIPLIKEEHIIKYYKGDLKELVWDTERSCHYVKHGNRRNKKAISGRRNDRQRDSSNPRDSQDNSY